MAESEGSGRGAAAACPSPPASPASPARPSPPKVVVDESPLQPQIDKHKESLKVKLMMRRPINQLVAQGIMPPLKTPPAYFEQCKQLERAKTGDLLKAKIQKRPDRQELERRHILEQESHVDPSLAEKQRMLKKARLADQLNDQLSHRPGPLELIKKNILHTEEDIETAVKSGTLLFKATSEGASGRPQHPSSYCGPPEEVSPSPSPPSTLSPLSITSPSQHPAPGKDKNRKKSKQKPQQQQKARFKFHEYKGPPNAQKASTPPGSVETPYDLLLQQQQLLLQLMLPASPAPSSSASVASDSSEAYVPPPPPPPPSASLFGSRFEDMKVSDLRAECKRRNLRVSGPKPQLLDRLRPYLMEKQDETPKSPASVASPDTRADSEPPEDIVQSQRRQIEELERKLEASRKQLEAVRRDAAGAAASEQSRRLLQAHLCVTQLRAQLDALQQPAAPQAASPRYVITADATPDRIMRLFTVSPQTSDATDATIKGNSTYILNGVKVVPIAILPSGHYSAPAPVPPPPPPPPPMPPVVSNHQTTVTDSQNNVDSQIMDDVLEILVENGELPASAVGNMSSRSIDSGFLTSESDFFPSSEIVSGENLAEDHVRSSIAADELQRELNDIQKEIMKRADMNVNNNIVYSNETARETDLNVDLLSNNDFQVDFTNSVSSADTNDFFTCFLRGDAEKPQSQLEVAMDTNEDFSEQMVMSPLTDGEILDENRTSFENIDELSLPSFQNEDSQQHNHVTTSCEFDFKDFGIDLSANANNNSFDCMDTDFIPNLFGRGHIPQCDPVLGGVLKRPSPRPARKHYSWEKIEYDPT